MRAAAALFEASFRQWEARTLDGNEVLLWSGKDAEVLWVEYRQPNGARFGPAVPASLVLWARTPAGQLFTVQCWAPQACRGDSLSAAPKQVGFDELRTALFKAGQLGILSRLGVIVRPA